MTSSTMLAKMVKVVPSFFSEFVHGRLQARISSIAVMSRNVSDRSFGAPADTLFMFSDHSLEYVQYLYGLY